MSNLDATLVHTETLEGLVDLLSSPKEAKALLIDLRALVRALKEEREAGGADLEKARELRTEGLALKKKSEEEMKEASRIRAEAKTSLIEGSNALQEKHDRANDLLARAESKTAEIAKREADIASAGLAIREREDNLKRAERELDDGRKDLQRRLDLLKQVREA